MNNKKYCFFLFFGFFYIWNINNVKCLYNNNIFINDFYNNNNNYNCQKIYCNKTLENNQCILIEDNISYFQKCKNLNDICDTISLDPTIDSFCSDKKKQNPLFYPGEPCLNNSECITNSCIDNKCYGKKLNEECNNTYECYYGYTCKLKENNNNNINNEKICQIPSKENENCSLDTDCELNYGCYNNKCTSYYSLSNGIAIDKYYNKSNLNLCKSGFIDIDNKCKSFTLINEENICDYNNNNSCIYSINDGLEEIEISLPENCLCGYNKNGNKYCKLGTSNYNYTIFINYVINYRKDNNNCHLNERSLNPCVKDIVNNTDKNIIKKVKLFYYYKYWATYNNLLFNGEQCAIENEFPFYEPNILKQGNCAKYKCNNNLDKNLCVKTTYESQFNITIDLKKCNNNKNKCDINGEPNYIFYQEKNYEATCEKNIYSLRFPGEECYNTSQCVYESICVEGKCSGIKKGKKCDYNYQCLAGLYCDINEGICKEQKNKDDMCNNSYECKNYLLCFEGKCLDKLFELKEYEKPPENEKNREKYCKYGILDKNGEFCGKIIDIKNNNNNKDGNYNKCERENQCSYLLNNIEYKIDCPCGYNSEGVGYCPQFHDYFKNDWKKYFKYLKKQYSNNCHTLNRYSCYLENKENLNEYKKLKNKLIYGHLFYKSVECAIDVLNFNLIKINYLILLFIIILIL